MATDWIPTAPPLTEKEEAFQRLLAQVRVMVSGLSSQEAKELATALSTDRVALGILPLHVARDCDPERLRQEFRSWLGLASGLRRSDVDRLVETVNPHLRDAIWTHCLGTLRVGIW